MSTDHNNFLEIIKLMLEEKSTQAHDSIAGQAIQRLIANDRKVFFEETCAGLQEYGHFKNPKNIGSTLIYFAQCYQFSFEVDTNHSRDIKRDIAKLKKSAITILSTLKGNKIGPIRDFFDEFVYRANKDNPEMVKYIEKPIESLLLELLDSLSKTDLKRVKLGRDVAGIRFATRILKKKNSKQSNQNLLALVIAKEFYDTTGFFLDTLNSYICEVFINSPKALDVREISSLRESVGLIKSKK
jgi:hypothetical protein